MPLFGGPNIPHFVAAIGWLVLLYVGLTGEAWFYAFLAHVGWPLGNSKIQRGMALSVLLLVVVIMGVQIADIVLSHLGSDVRLLSADDLPSLRDRHGQLDPDAQVQHYNRGLFIGGVYLVTALLFCMRAISMAGLVRQAIRRWIADQESAMMRQAD